MIDEESKAGETVMEGNETKKDEIAVNVQRYGILMSYLQYENSSFWNRNNFFMVANAALLGFLIPKLPKICPPESWEKIIIHFFYCIAGLLLSCLWRSGLKKSRMWIDHWRAKLDEIEKRAWGNGFYVFPKKPIGAIKNAYHIVRLFLGIWIISIPYFILAICVKCDLFKLCGQRNLFHIFLFC